MKVLLSAYACEPDRGSEPGVGWAWANSLSKHTEVTVVTRANNEEVINSWYDKHGHDDARPNFQYYDPSSWILWLKKKKLLPVQVFYVIWQLAVAWKYRSAGRDHDVVHHVTFNSMMMPGFWWFISVPVVLGPLGGTSCVKGDYRSLFGRRLWKERVRETLIRHWTWLPWIRFSFNHATAIFCANSETRRHVDTRYHEKTVTMLETGVDMPAENVSVESNGRSSFRIMWVGTIEPWKALTIALTGFQSALDHIPQGVDVHLDIVGNGSEEKHAEELVKEAGMDDRVTFHGWVPKNEVDQMMSGADALLFTSVKDTSGNVVLEAMLNSLPVICINHQGVGDMTTDETAIRIDPGSLTSTVRRVGDAIVSLVREPDMAERLGAAGYRRVQAEYSWRERAKNMYEVYKEIINLKKNK